MHYQIVFVIPMFIKRLSSQLLILHVSERRCFKSYGKKMFRSWDSRWFLLQGPQLPLFLFPGLGPFHVISTRSSLKKAKKSSTQMPHSICNSGWNILMKDKVEESLSFDVASGSLADFHYPCHCRPWRSGRWGDLCRMLKYERNDDCVSSVWFSPGETTF